MYPSKTRRYVGWGRAATIGGTSLEEYCEADNNKDKGSDNKGQGSALAGAAAKEEGNYTLVQSKRALVDLGLIDQR